VTLSDGLSVDAKHLALIRLLEKMVETFTGRKIKIRPHHFDRAQRVQGRSGAQSLRKRRTARTGRRGGSDTTRPRPTYERQASITVDGTVKTGDGKEIGFSLNTRCRGSCTRSHPSTPHWNAQVVDPCESASTGAPRSLRTPSSPSIWMRRDAGDHLLPRSGNRLPRARRGGHRTVADGSQLFGPSTGNGFSELSALDSDGNGWIDENDAAFDDLRIWTKDAAGNDVLSTLLERNVGAICLGNVEASFDLLGPGNAENGELARLGVWLEEDGGGAGIAPRWTGGVAGEERGRLAELPSNLSLTAFGSGLAAGVFITSP
jgi:hypothetical protein